MPEERRGKSDRLGAWLSVFVICLLGASLRIFHILRSDFPLNDGGFFYTMIQDLVSNHFLLPKYTSYNLLNIPFAYPPLPFYLGGLLQEGFDIDLLAILRWAPVIFSILSIPTFFLLSREALESTPQALHATLVFSILTPVFEWLIMGAGLTRAPGFLFCILALWQAWRALRTHQRQAVFLTAVFVALCGYCHLEALIIAAGFILTATWFKARNHWGMLFLAKVAILSLALLTPYIITVARQHGLTVFFSALQSGDFDLLYSIGKLLFGNLTVEFMFTPFLVFALMGVGRRLHQQDYLFPALMVVAALLTPRSLERSVAIPLSWLAAIAIDEIVLPGLARIATHGTDAGSGLAKKLFPSFLGGVLIIYFALRSAFLSLLYLMGVAPTLRALPPADRTAMEWVAANTSAEAVFIGLTPPGVWLTDYRAEWFPTLAKRINLNTVQGSEWLPGGFFQEQVDFYERITECVFRDASCVEQVLQEEGREIDYIYLSGQIKEKDTGFTFDLPILESLLHDSHYRLDYQHEDVYIFERNRST